MKKLILLFAILIPLFAQSQVERIKILSISRPQPGYAEVQTQMRLQLPSALATNAQARRIFKTYMDRYNVLRLDTIATVVYAVIRPEGIAVTLPATLAQARANILAKYTTLQSQINSFTFLPLDGLIWQYYDGTSWGNSSINDSL
jgi:hypothetical protein